MEQPQEGAGVLRRHRAPLHHLGRAVFQHQRLAPLVGELVSREGAGVDIV